MKFAAKKECLALLAFLGEESWRSANIQNGNSPFAQVSWVDGHIVTVRQAGGHLLLRVGVALVSDQGEIVERLLKCGRWRITAFLQERSAASCWRRYRGMFQRGAKGGL